MNSKFFANNRKKLIESADVDIVILTGNSYIQASADRVHPFQQDTNFFYLSGINEPGMKLVISKKEEYLIVPERSPARIAFEGQVRHEDLSEVSGIKKIYNQKVGWEILEKDLKKTRQVGILKPIDNYIEGMDMFANPARKHLQESLLGINSTLSFADLRPTLASMRMIKSDTELQMIKQAIRHSQNLYRLIEEKRLTVKNEKDLLVEINSYSIGHQLEFAYEPIIASGINSVTLHYEKNNQPISPANALLLDIGLKYQGYSADITRTVFKDPTKHQMDVYDAVRSVQDYAVSLLKPGVKMKDYEAQVTEFIGQKLIDLNLIKQISKESVRKYYPHSTSHFLGLDVHDVGDYTKPLQPGMVLTVEPGIYIEEESLGIRIEDNIVITENGNKLLTDLPRNPSSLTIKP